MNMIKRNYKIIYETQAIFIMSFFSRDRSSLDAKLWGAGYK